MKGKDAILRRPPAFSFGGKNDAGSLLGAPALRGAGVWNFAWLPGPPVLSHCDVCLEWPCATRRAADPGPGPGAYDAPVTAASSKHSRGPAPAFGSGRTGSLGEWAAATMCAAVGLQCSAGRDIAALQAS